MTQASKEIRPDRVTLFLQAPVPGVTPYCGGAHLWGDSLRLLGGNRHAVAVDLPGCAGRPVEGVPTVDAMAADVVQYIRAQGLQGVQLIGHDFAGLVALLVAMEHPDLLSSVCVASSHWASPSEGGIGNYTLRHPPLPLWSATSQSWALDRLSYSHQHIDAALLEGCAAAARGAGHASAVAAMGTDGAWYTFMGSVVKVKHRFFSLARDKGLAVPILVVTGQNDPLVAPAYMLGLFRIAAARQRHAQFHIISRAGAFPFREQPAEFYRVVSAFAEGLEAQSQADPFRQIK